MLYSLVQPPVSSLSCQTTNKTSTNKTPTERNKYVLVKYSSQTRLNPILTVSQSVTNGSMINFDDEMKVSLIT